jgi:lysine 6-dehydrogenase
VHYLLLGAGLQGTAIAWDLLHHAADTASLTVIDRDPAALSRLEGRLQNDPRLSLHCGDVEDIILLAPLFESADVIISAVNYWFNDELTALAITHRAHFLDLGGNNEIVARQLARHDQACRSGVTVVPDTGLAPGLAGILGWHLAQELDACEAIRLRVGGLPLSPRPPLNYQLVFSVQGLINEYVEDCLVIRDGAIATVPGLSELETLEFPPPFGKLEAFQTSGGTSTLPQSLLGRVRSLDYKTIRYPGHCEQIRLLRELALTDGEPMEVDGAWVSPRNLLARRLESVLPCDGDDVVLLLAEAEGFVNRADRSGQAGSAQGAHQSGHDAPNRHPLPQARRLSIRIIDRNDPATGLSAMTRMTGFPAAIIAHMLASGQVSSPGASPQETIIPAERMLAELERRGVRIERWQSDPARPNPGPTG